MKCYGRAAVSDFLGDQIVFRSLSPLDPCLPGLPAIRSKLGYAEDFLPRKSMPEYGAVIAEIIQAARKRGGPNATLKRVVYVGDTRMNDGEAFLNICQAGSWPGMAFIGCDSKDPFHCGIEQQGSQTIYSANRWKAIEKFDRFLKEKQFFVDEQTAILFDLDKTLLGARGRNDRVIDEKRLNAAEDTLREALGKGYHPDQFQAAYHQLNQVEFHPFTADNQDYLVYICLMISSGLISLPELIGAVRSGKPACFYDFLHFVEEKKSSLPSKVMEIHQRVYGRAQAGDPTPFKTFRHNEFRRTAEHMGHLPDPTPVEKILAQEIVITEEIRRLATRWKEQGALMFGLSDKPDEATLPSEELKTQGYLPVHQIVTHSIGEENDI